MTCSVSSQSFGARKEQRPYLIKMYDLIWYDDNMSTKR